MAAEQRLVWINKTAASKQLTRSEGTEKSELFRHVQRTIHNLSDCGKDDRVPSSGKNTTGGPKYRNGSEEPVLHAFSSSSSSSYVPSVLQTCGAVGLQYVPFFHVQESIRNAINPPGGEEDRDSQKSTIAEGSAVVPSRSPSPIRAWVARVSHSNNKKMKTGLQLKSPTKGFSPKALVVGKNNVDPFNCTVVPLSAVDVLLLQHYFSIVQHDGGVRLDCPSCTFATESLHDALHMYSLLALSAARFREVENLTLDRRETPEYYNGKAITLLRQRMDGVARLTPDRHAMLDVLRLSTCEWYLHNKEAARTHLSYFIQVWDTLDIETSPFDLHLHNTIAVNDIILAVATDTQPVLHVHHSISTTSFTTCGKIGRGPSAGTGSALAKLCKTADIGQNLKCIVYDTISFLYPGQAAPENHHLSSTIRRLLRSQTLALMHTLLNNHSSDCFEQALRWTLLLIMTPVVTTPSWLAGKINIVVLADRLRSLLQACWRRLILAAGTDNDTYYGSEIWLWMCLTGVYAASGDEDRHAWFLRRAIDFAKHLQINTAEQLEAKVDEFVLCQCVHGHGMQALAEAMDLVPPTLRRHTIYDRIALAGDDAIGFPGYPLCLLVA